MKMLLQFQGRQVTAHFFLQESAYQLTPIPPYKLEPCGAALSEQQVILRQDDDGYTICVNDPHFNLRVNGELVQQKKLAPGDRIQLDKEITFLYLNIPVPSAGNESQTMDVGRWEWLHQYRNIKDITRKLYSAAHLPDLLYLLLEEAVQLTGMERGFIALSDDNDEIDLSETNRIEFSKSPTQVPLTFPNSVVQQVIHSGEWIFLPAKDRDIITRFPEIERFSLQALICHPLTYKERLIGILYLDARHACNELTEFHHLLFSILMDHAEIAIGNLKRYQQSSQLNHHLKNKIEESEKRFRQIVELSPDAIFVHSDERLVYINPAGVKMLGAETPAELLGKPVLDLIHPDYHELVKRRINMELETESPVPLIEEKLIRLDGQPVTVEVTAASIPYDGKIAALVVARDITEKLLIAEERLKSQKAESLATLAGGIAHDFNNILTAILGYLSLAKTENLGDSTKLLKDLENAEKGALRAKSLTRQLLTFAKGETPEKKVGNIASLIRETVPFLLYGSAVRLELSIDDDLWHVQMDEGQIGQVISNLTINAVQAMPDGGTIRVTGENASLDKKNPLSIPAGKYIKISFQDTGTGIPKSMLSKIFDPYFTTKETGSGLGLATSISIIKRHNGTITVDSTPGTGSNFTLYLPASSQKIEESIVDYPTVSPGKGKILVMDDEEYVQSFAYSALTNLGYDVKIARDGNQTINLYREALAEKIPFDVVIIDLTIPGGMGGKETIRRLRELDPDVTAVVSSGYSTNPILANYRAYGFDAILEKPYRINDLSEVLKKVLSRKAVASKGR